MKKYDSCTAPIGKYCSKHGCTHKKIAALKPCPFCGNERVRIQTNAVHVHWVSCSHCGTDGPWSENLSKSVTQWNEAKR